MFILKAKTNFGSKFEQWFTNLELLKHKEMELKENGWITEWEFFSKGF